MYHNIKYMNGEITMKTPLGFQVTESDCGTVALINAITYLFERKEIPVELIRAIYLQTLDRYDENGNLGAGGTSKNAIKYLTEWIAKYAKKKKFTYRLQKIHQRRGNT